MFTVSAPIISQAIPDDWKIDGHARIVYSGYQCLSPKSPSLETGWKVDLGNAMVLAIWGTCDYVDNLQKPNLTFNEDGKLQVTPTSRGEVRTDAQANIIILQRIAPDQYGDEPDLESARQVICGLLSINFSNTITYSKLFVNVIDTKKQELSAFAGKLAVKSTLLFQPLFSQERADYMVTIYSAILRKQELGDRYLRALNWYDIGHRATDTVDAFINIWIAIEALVLNNQANIYPLKKSIADAYGLTSDEANHHFGLGRICNIRSTLFHGQNRPQIEIAFIEYLEAVFADVLHQELSLKCEQRAKIFLNGKGFNQSNWAPKTTRGS